MEVSGNVQILPSGARNTTQTSPDIAVTAGALHVVLDVTVIGTGSLTVTINGKDPVSGKYYPLLVGAAVVGNGTTVYKVGRGLPATANVSANDAVPGIVQVVVTANNANPVTYSVGLNTIAV